MLESDFFPWMKMGVLYTVYILYNFCKYNNLLNDYCTHYAFILGSNLEKATLDLCLHTHKKKNNIRLYLKHLFKGSSHYSQNENHISVNQFNLTVVIWLTWASKTWSSLLSRTCLRKVVWQWWNRLCGKQCTVLFEPFLSEEKTTDVDILENPEFSSMTVHHTKDSKNNLMEFNHFRFPEGQGHVSWNGLIMNGAMYKLYMHEKNIWNSFVVTSRPNSTNYLTKQCWHRPVYLRITTKRIAITRYFHIKAW